MALLLLDEPASPGRRPLFRNRWNIVDGGGGGCCGAHQPASWKRDSHLGSCGGPFRGSGRIRGRTETAATAASSAKASSSSTAVCGSSTGTSRQRPCAAAGASTPAPAPAARPASSNSSSRSSSRALSPCTCWPCRDSAGGRHGGAAAASAAGPQPLRHQHRVHHQRGGVRARGQLRPPHHRRHRQLTGGGRTARGAGRAAVAACTLHGRPTRAMLGAAACALQLSVAALAWAVAHLARRGDKLHLVHVSGAAGRDGTPRARVVGAPLLCP